MFCPNFKNKEVFDGFNEMVEAFGGRALTEEEFKNKDLRSQRSGVDFSAMEAAYKVYHLNGGNMLDLTPDGKESKLFKDLLENFNGDRKLALKAKGQLYSENFRNWFGDWLSVKERVEKVDIYRDIIIEGTLDNVNPKIGKSVRELDNETLQSISDDTGVDITKLLKVYDSVFKYIADHGKMPGRTNGELGELARNAFGDNYVDTIRFAYDKNDRDIQFDLSSDYNEAMMDLAKLKKQHPDLDLGVETFYEVKQENSEEFDEIMSAMFSSDAILSPYGALDAIKQQKKKISNEVSKVIDENGEPLVVYHYTENKDLQEFDPTFDNYFSTKNPGNTKNAFFFTLKQEDGQLLGRKSFIATFLNIKDLEQYSGTKDELRQLEDFTSIINRLGEDGNKNSGVRFDGIDDNKKEGQTVIVATDPNQVKSIKNNGEFSTTDNNIYHQIATESIQQNESNGLFFLLDNFSIQKTLGLNLLERLRANGLVGSSEILQQILNSGIIGDNIQLQNVAKMLQKHNIPIRLISVNSPIVASTVTNKRGSVILINEKLISKVSNQYVVETLLHEITHAVTVEAITNPKTEEERIFARKTKDIFAQAKRQIKYENIPVEFDHAFENELEFAAFVASDPQFVDWLTTKSTRNKTFLQKLKNFVNSVVRLFVNKDLFNVPNQTIDQYRLDLYNYMNGVNTNHVAPTKLSLKDAWDRIDYDGQLIENYLNCINGIRQQLRIKINHQGMFVQSSKTKTVTADISSTAKKISNILEVTRRALNNAVVPEHERAKRTQSIDQQILQFASEQISTYLAILSMTRQVGPQIANEFNKILQVLTGDVEMSDAEVIFLTHDNIGAYSKIYDRVSDLLINDQMMQNLINDCAKNGETITLDEVKALKKQVVSIKTVLDEISSALSTVLKYNLKKTADLVSHDVNNGELIEYFDNYIYSDEIFDSDINLFSRWLGSADSSKNPLVRTLDYLVRKADNTVREAVNEKMYQLIKLQSELPKNEHVFWCYELDENGEPTGYLVRSRNYGRFYKAYGKFIVSNNSEINKIYGANLKEDNRIPPSDFDITITEEIKNQVRQDLHKLDNTDQLYQVWEDLPDSDKMRYHWFTKTNYFLAEHCDRRHTKEYYQAWASISHETSETLKSLNIRISAITRRPEVVDEKGYTMYEKLTDEELSELDDLRIQKRLLKSDLDEFGNPKSGAELKLAREILRLYKMLYGDSFTAQHDKEAWQERRQYMLDTYGENSKEFLRWDKLNTQWKFKEAKNGNWKILEKINEELQGREIDYGEEYNAINDELNAMLRPYRKGNEHLPSKMPERLKNRAINLSFKLDAIRSSKHNQSKKLKELSKIRAELFKKYVDFVPNSDFEHIKQEEFDFYSKILEQEDIIDIIKSKYGTVKYDYDTEEIIDNRYYKWYTKMVAKEEYKKEFMEEVPSDAWLDFEDETKNLNKDFDESENQTWVPKMEMYDNREKFARVSKKGTKINEYYEAIKATIAESNEMQTNRNYCDNYLLPQIHGDFFSMMKRKGFKTKLASIMYSVLGYFGIGKRGRDEEYVLLVGQTLELSTDETGAVYDAKNLETYGSRADGKHFRVIPQSYIAKMENPAEISRELTMITMCYYEMSKNFQEKTKIKDKCELIVDQLDKQELKRGFRLFGNGLQSNTSAFANDYLKRNLYGEAYTRERIAGIQVAKLVAAAAQLTTASNLGMNPKVAIQSFMSSMYCHIINGIVGQKYTFSTECSAGKESVIQILKMLRNGTEASNPLSNNKVVGMMEMINMMGQSDKKVRALNFTTNRLGRIFDMARQNWCFGLMSSLDFVAKSNVLVSTYMSYRMVDGKFVTMDDLLQSRASSEDRKNDKEAQDRWYKEQKSKWQSGVCLYDVLNMKDGKIQCDPLYKYAYEKIKFIVANRANNYAEQCDGMAQKLQKTMFAHTFIGALCSIHRQYLPLMLQERFGHTVYDYNTQLYKNGQWRTLIDFIIIMTFESKLASIGLGAGSGAIFFGPVGALIGGGISWYISHKRGSKWIGNYKQAYLKFTNDTTDEDLLTAQKKTVISNMRKYHLRQILAEALLSYAYKHAVGYVCAWADDDDDNLLLNFFALCLEASYWEAISPTNLTDIIQTFKSPSAALGLYDKIANVAKQTLQTTGGMLFGNGYTGGVFRMIFDLFNINSDLLFNGSFDDVIQKGVYEGWTKQKRFAFQAFVPFHNTYEQWLGSKQKRSYIENKMFEEKFPTILYDIFHPNKSQNIEDDESPFNSYDYQFDDQYDLFNEPYEE